MLDGGVICLVEARISNVGRLRKVDITNPIFLIHTLNANTSQLGRAILQHQLQPKVEDVAHLAEAAFRIRY